MAKVASDYGEARRPCTLPLDLLPKPCARLSLRDLRHWRKTEKRLNDKGIHTMEQLLALNCEQAGELWAQCGASGCGIGSRVKTSTWRRQSI